MPRKRKYAFKDDPMVTEDTDSIFDTVEETGENAQADVFMSHLVNDYHMVGKYRTYFEVNNVSATLGLIRNLYKHFVVSDGVPENVFVVAVEKVMRKEQVLSLKSVGTYVLVAQKKQWRRV